MAYDAELAERIRDQLAGIPGVREKKMFGGLAFMINDKMAVCAVTQGDLMLLVDPRRVDRLLGDGVQRATMKGRELRTGWIVVDADLVSTPDRLTPWLGHALTHNRRSAD